MMRDQFFDGLIRQLRSIPVGLRVDSWLIREYPDLAEQQRTVINKQLAENLSALGPDVRDMAPDVILNANLGMNAAFALFWSRTWNEKPLSGPYMATGHLSVGESLLKLWDELNYQPVHDKDLIEAWGDHLGMAGWFEFVPYRLG